MVSQHEDGTMEFVFFRPAARSVTLAGDFNDWQANQHIMARDEAGWWHVRVKMPPGEYRFKYRIDNAWWEADFAAYGVENDKHGGWNSVLWVQTPAEPVAAPLRIAA